MTYTLRTHSHIYVVATDASGATNEIDLHVGRITAPSMFRYLCEFTPNVKLVQMTTSDGTTTWRRAE